MIELYPEFYNDVFGPIIQPVSSSHMAAPSKKLSAPCMRILVSVGWPCDPIPGGKDMPCMARVLYVADTIGRGLSGDLLCTARADIAQLRQRRSWLVISESGIAGSNDSIKTDLIHNGSIVIRGLFLNELFVKIVGG